MKRYFLIRHGQTQGNLEHRYIGCKLDEPLCPQGVAALRAGRYPTADKIFSSPLRRCLETAALLYPGQRPTVIPALRECDFGDFEGKNYAELNGRADYQAWIDSGGTLPFPGGESQAAFAARCADAFAQAVRPLPDGDYAFVVHGGTIMAIMERLARPKGAYFDFQVANGGGYCLDEQGHYAPLEPGKGPGTPR